jgi:hypothetical protein
MPRRQCTSSSLPQQKIRQLWQPAVKAFLFTIIFLPVLSLGVLVGLTTVIPDSYALRDDAQWLKDWVRAELNRLQPDPALRNDAWRLRLGALSENPENHYRLSFVEETDGNLEKAIDEMDLALGLLELSPGKHRQYAAYMQRRDALKQALIRRQQQQ